MKVKLTNLWFGGLARLHAYRVGANRTANGLDLLGEAFLDVIALGHVWRSNAGKDGLRRAAHVLIVKPDGKTMPPRFPVLILTLDPKVADMRHELGADLRGV